MMSTLFHVILVAVSQTALEVIGVGGGGGRGSKALFRGCSGKVKGEEYK